MKTDWSDLAQGISHDAINVVLRVEGVRWRMYAALEWLANDFQAVGQVGCDIYGTSPRAYLDHLLGFTEDSWVGGSANFYLFSALEDALVFRLMWGGILVDDLSYLRDSVERRHNGTLGF